MLEDASRTLDLTLWSPEDNVYVSSDLLETMQPFMGPPQKSDQIQ